MNEQALSLTEDVVMFIMTCRDEELAVLTVSEIAQRFDIDRFKLTRQFKNSKNTTLEFFINREKMIRSAFLLSSNKNMTVEVIAKRMGFCTSSYFSQVFEKFFGIGPGKYRAYRRLRSGIKDRRTGPENRRQRPGKSTSSLPERRKGPVNRRNGIKDRRKDTVENTNRVSIQYLLRMMS